jgi:hypothetical protein
MKSHCLQTIERYLPGARHAQRMLVGTAGIVLLTFAIIGSGTGDEAWFFATLPLLALLAFAVIMLLRKVTYTIDSTSGNILRIAQWGGYTLSERQLNAGEFETIRIGSFNGQPQAYPVYWAQLLGRSNYTLIESGQRKEVWAAAEKAGKLLKLPVSFSVRCS